MKSEIKRVFLVAIVQFAVLISEGCDKNLCHFFVDQLGENNLL